jgi:hypothetical protein
MTEDQAIEEAGAILARARADQADRTPAEAARAAFVPGGPSEEELEARIRARRGMPAKRSDAA